MTPIEFFAICRNVTISPFAFFRNLEITEGLRRPVYFALIMYYIRGAGEFYASYKRGWFLIPEIQVHPVSSTFAAAALCVAPFLLLLIIYSQSIMLDRISKFFGGAGNLEGALKVIAYTLFISLFMLIPGVDIVARIYSVIVLIIGAKEIYNLDWISAILGMLFSFLFTAVLYIFLFMIPAYFMNMITVSFL